MAIADINFGEWYPIAKLKATIDEHRCVEDIHSEYGDREANKDAKKFYDEILPIFCYAEDCGASEVLYVDDSTTENSYDGQIKVDGNVIYIECTKAISQENAILQRAIDEECYQFGYSELPRVSSQLIEFRKRISHCIQRSIENKIERSQKRPGKYNGFHLILTLDETDFMFCNKEDIVKGINNYFTLRDITPFMKVILYGKTNTGFPEKITEIIKC